MSNHLATLILVLSTSVLWLPSVCADEDKRVVKVTGTAVAKVKPDMVVWTITVTHTDTDLTAAREANDQGVRRVLELRSKLDIDAQDVQTGNLRIQKVYERDRSGNEGAFRHYSVRRIIMLRQRDTSKFDDILQDLTAAENVSIGYSLASSEFHKVRRETRLRAVEVAREKAHDMTSLLGATLGPVVTIDETSAGRESWQRSPVSNSLITSGEPAQPDDIQGTFAPGAISIRVSVDIQFAIE